MVSEFRIHPVSYTHLIKFLSKFFHQAIGDRILAGKREEWVHKINFSIYNGINVILDILDVYKRQGEPLAMHFLSLGYHACVLQYSVSPEAFYPTQLLEVTESVRQIHEHAKEWYIDTKKIVLAGASAGGHLAANYCAFWKREFLVERCV